MNSGKISQELRGNLYTGPEEVSWTAKIQTYKLQLGFFTVCSSKTSTLIQGYG
jgi:hypothetical protein